MKKTIRDFDLKNKKVMIRVDFNVPLNGDIILDDYRIKQSFETIKYAIDQDAKVILLSHLGRVKTIEDKDKYSLEPVALRLSELLDQEVIFVAETRGTILEEEINQLEKGQVLLIENTRFEDLDGKKESNCDEELSKYWASLGDIFINDAFATSHRKHASNVGIASYLPSGIGFLIEKELKELSFVLEEEAKPLVAILGGSKVSDKIGVIESIGKKADYLLIGGSMANTFLKASGMSIGSSRVELDFIDFAARMLEEYKDSLILPIDVVVADCDYKQIRTCFINEVKEEEFIYDIGPTTLKLFQQYIGGAKTVFWNGPVGYFENSAFENGTKQLSLALGRSSAQVIVGGGDSAEAVKKYEVEDKIDYISTGGGASLAYLEGLGLEGIDCIADE